MFDIGFWEVVLVIVIGLIVLGPERLPTAARTLGRWVGWARRSAQNLRDEVEDSLDAGDLREDFKSFRHEVDAFRSEVDSARGEIVRGGRQLRAEVEGDDTTQRAPRESRTNTGPGDADWDQHGEMDGGRRLRVETGDDSPAVDAVGENTAERDGGDAPLAAADTESHE